MQDLQSLLTEIDGVISAQEDRGSVADYIPELAKQDNRKFGMAIATIDGQVFTAGAASDAFSIQSISKVFTLTMALARSATAFGNVWAANRRDRRSIPSCSLNMKTACRVIRSSTPGQSS